MAGRTPAASPDHHQAHLLIEAARFYAQLTKWDDRFAGTPPYRVPHLVYAPYPFEAEGRHWIAVENKWLATRYGLQALYVRTPSGIS